MKGAMIVLKDVYSNTCVKRPLKTNYCLMQVKSIAECSKGSILQYFRLHYATTCH